MSPAARKFKDTLNLPTIASGLLVAESDVIPNFYESNLSIAHNAKMSNGLMKDWMNFTNVLGNGIFDNI